MSYGTSAGVAVLTPKWSADGTDFSTSTTPTKATVTEWITRVSAMVDALLANEGFAIPVTDADVVNILEGFIEGEVAAIVEGVNGSGRFGPTAKPKGTPKGRWQIVMDDVVKFVERFGTGMEQLGATRTRPITDGLEGRETDDAGDDIHPMFQRRFANWNVIDFDQE